MDHNHMNMDMNMTSNTGGSSVGGHKTAFQASVDNVILFQSWVTTNGWQYALSLLAIAVFSFLVQVYNVYLPTLLRFCENK